MKKNLTKIIRAIPKYFSPGLKFAVCCLVLAMSQASLSAQDKAVSGKIVSPAGEPLAGVTVGVKNSTKRTTTGTDGNFRLSVANDAILEITYVGYKMQELPVSGKTDFQVTLATAENTMSDVVVVGYTSQKKSSLTGAVASVNMADLAERRVPDVAQLLQGQVAGVQVTQSTGAPGDGINITIRGVGTFAGSSPLYIVDGMPSTEISFLNPTDIQSMTVLKDAAAAAIYGARASGGVIVITTKSGKKGKSNLDISYFNGIQKVTNLPTMLNSTQYLNKMEESWINAGYTKPNPYTKDKSRTDFANTDWLDELFVLGKSQSLQLSASGGTDKIQYLISGGYYGQDGIVIYDHDKFQRINFRTNVNANITDRFTVGVNVQLSNTRQDKISSKGDEPGVIRHAFIRPPVISVFKDINDPNYTAEDPYTDLPFYTQIYQINNKWVSDSNHYEQSANPVAIANFTNDKRTNFKTFGNIFAEYAFLGNKELKFRTNLGVDLNMTHNKAFNKNYGDDDGQGAPIDQGTGRKNRPAGLIEDRGQETTITWNNTLNYNKRIQNHSFSILVGSEYITNYSSSVGGSRARFEYTSPAFQYLNFGGSQLDVSNGGGASQWALFSLFGSVNYNYDNRFFATGSIRRDASSQFAKNNQQAYFPSVSAGWRISQEKFMQDISWLSDLKLRASSGKLGNQSGLVNYNSLTIYRRSGDQYIISRYGNDDLKWETTQQNNIGIDLGLFKNKITLSADYFKKTTSDILLPLSLPALVGDVQPTMVNAGEVTNKGFELALGYRNNDHALKYNVNANIATVSNMVDKLHPNSPNIIGEVSKTEPGHPLYSYYGYQMSGIYQNQKEIDGYLTGASHPDVKPGDIKFSDLNGDGIISDNDRTYLGNPNPRLTYGLNLSASFKGFDFSVLFQGVSGVEKFNDLKRIIDYDTRPFNHTVATLNAWHGEGTSNSIPRSTFTDNGSSKVSSIYIEDASYLRLKNIELGYTLSSLFGRSNAAFQNIRLFISAQNLFTVTDYTGLDPESVDMIDKGTYPQSKAVLFGINIKL